MKLFLSVFLHRFVVSEIALGSFITTEKSEIESKDYLGGSGRALGTGARRDPAPARAESGRGGRGEPGQVGNVSHSF